MYKDRSIVYDLSIVYDRSTDQLHMIANIITATCRQVTVKIVLF